MNSTTLAEQLSLKTDRKNQQPPTDILAFQAYVNHIARNQDQLKIVLESPEFAQQMDAHDPLREFRTMFTFPKRHHGNQPEGDFRGNSLGRQPIKTKEYMINELEIRENRGHEGHFEESADGDRMPWWKYHERFQKKLAPLFGCQEDEAIPMGTLSANNVTLLDRFYYMAKRQGRKKIIIEQGLFPSDIDTVRGVIIMHLGIDPAEVDEYIIEVPRREDNQIHTEDIQQAIQQAGDEFAMVFMGGINYYTGQVLDMNEITSLAHQAGGYAGFDLAHAAGNIPLQLHDREVDFATACSYKYLNSGPGSTGIAYAHSKHHEHDGFKTTFGRRGRAKESRFTFEASDPRAYEAAEGIRRILISNDGIFSMVPLMPSLNIFEEADISRLRNKSLLLTGYLEYLLHEMVGKDSITIITPQDPTWRGAQLSFKIINENRGINLQENAKYVHDQLHEQGFGVEQRDDIIRIAPAPLYNTFEEVYKVAQAIKAILEQKREV